MHLPEPLPARIRIDGLRPGNGLAVDVGHPYLERCYTPFLGAVGVLALRRLGEHLENRASTSIEVSELAAELGLSRGLGRSAPIVRCLNRLIDFHLARWDGERLGVSVAVPILGDRRVDRLPARAQVFHRRLARAIGDRPLVFSRPGLGASAGSPLEVRVPS